MLFAGIRSRISSLFGWLFRLTVLNFGWLYVLAVHLPAGFLRRKIKIWRDWLAFNLSLGKRSHARKVAGVQKQLNKWYKISKAKDRRQLARLCTSSSTSGKCQQQMCFTRPYYKKGMYTINLDRLCDIIEINTNTKCARVEPKVSVDQLQLALLPLGFTLPIVPEIGDLEIGGLCLGAGIGSGSARHGLFQHICLAYELVTTGGEVIIAEKDGEHQSLFFGIPWSLGSLGFLVSVSLQIVACPPFVRLQYRPCFSVKELTGRLEEETRARAGNDFVEALQFDTQLSVLICGKFVDRVPKNDGKSLNKIGRCFKPYFFVHARRMVERGITKTEYIPSGDYFRRHWRSLFWEIHSLVPPILFVIFPLLRPFLNFLLPPALPFPKSDRVRRIYSQQHVLQNLMVPLKNLPDTLAMIERELRIYPLWLCPFALLAQPGLLRNRQGLRKMHVNVGIYGQPNKRRMFFAEEEGVEVEERMGGEGKKKTMAERLRALEEHARNVQGFQMICADSQQNAAEFWEMFDATLYGWLRAKYECKEALPSVFDKVSAENRR